MRTTIQTGDELVFETDNSIVLIEVGELNEKRGTPSFRKTADYPKNLLAEFAESLKPAKARK